MHVNLNTYMLTFFLSVALVENKDYIQVYENTMHAVYFQLQPQLEHDMTKLPTMYVTWFVGFFFVNEEHGQFVCVCVCVCGRGGGVPPRYFPCTHLSFPA